MGNENSIRLSTFELVSSLALCGYESMASQMINSLGINGDLVVANRFVEQTEGSLKLKGFWDDQSPTMLVSGLENLLHLLVQSKRKVRCIKGEQVLFIHLLDKNKILIQNIENQNHTFSIQALKKSTFINLFQNLFGLNNADNTYKGELNTLLFTENLFNKIHNLEPENIEQVYSDKNLDKELRTFLSDFNKNNQEFNNVSFMEMDYVKDNLELREVLFLLINEQFIWHLDYDDIKEDKIYIIPTNVNEYFSSIADNVYDFFSDQIIISN